MSVQGYGVSERIFMLDCARKYFTPEWIKRLITEIAAVGYNVIVIHFSEDMGMRLESKTYPWLAGGDHSLCVFGTANGRPEDDGKFITQDEMADIVRHAYSLGVEVIPSLDSPGHMNYVVKKYNEHYGTDIANYFHKDGKVSVVQGSSIYKEQSALSHSRGIDITNPEAVKFAESLYLEYGKFFRCLGCKRFNISADELLGFGESIDDSVSKWQNLEHWDEYAKDLTGNERAVAYDAFILYVNGVCAMLRELGYESILMWNDDAYRSFDTGWQGVCGLDKSIDILYWSTVANNGLNTPRFYLTQGHRIYNFALEYTYYTLYPDRAPTKHTPEEIEEEWNPLVFDSADTERNLSPEDGTLLGAGICLWSDTPNAMEEDELLVNIRPYFTAIAKKAKGE